MVCWNRRKIPAKEPTDDLEDTMKALKKSLATILVLVMALGTLSACGAQDGGGQSASQGEPQSTGAEFQSSILFCGSTSL